jgi:Asp-tRNA(Asn)/Glu-tRNA(Gln) amidotransferase B subunit
MSLLEKAKEHYKGKLSAEPRELRIPEWNDTVYVRPGISMQSLGEIMELANSGNSAEAMVMTLIHRLVDGEGKPVFKKIEKTELLRSVDPEVIARIVGEIGQSDPSEDDISGN